jgi:glycosyltransferase involved in cell wall biosynthesis
MRLLLLSNFYPPASRGGFEQWCQEVAEGLNARGHQVMVLTSRHGQEQLEGADPDWVRRELYLEMELATLRNGLQFFTNRKARENENMLRLRRLVESFEPDVILIWGMWNLPRSLPALAEKLKPGRVAYYMGDYWPTLPGQHEVYWQVPPRNWVTSIPKALLRPVAERVLANEEKPALEFERVIFPTVFMRDEFQRRGILLHETSTIYGAIDTSLYPYRNGLSDAQHDGELSLLYIGRLSPDKGVHTAIKALGNLVHVRGFNQLRLTVIGTGEPEYEAHLRYLAREEKVQSLVTFLGAQPKEAMSAFYRRADLFLFTSVWPEPFGRVIVEAMASGVAVVGTATGGAAEILVENENALLFPPGDAISLAEQIARLVESPTLRQQLAQGGRRTALTKFDLQRMTTDIEAYLQESVIEQG